MPSFHTGTVTEILEHRPGLQRVLVLISTRDGGAEAAEPERAYVLTDLIGDVQVGDALVLNTTAVDLGLGTGGWHVGHWNLSRDHLERPGPGHIMKLRYTSLQVDTGAAEEDDPDREAELGGLPVVVCDLHSQMGVIAAVFKHLSPGHRLSYVMTDGASLPMALSDLVAGLVDRDVLDGTITAGNAFGGDLEAVTVASALNLAVSRQDAQAVIVAMGPGIVGTGSRLGNSGLEVASIVDMVAALGADPIVALRVSSGDPRARHRGVSHHSLTALSLCNARASVAVADAVDLGAHDVEVVEVPPVAQILDDLGVHITTMGRDQAEDPDFFAAAACAGRLLAARVGRR
jgi:hypothetical protein